MSGCDVCFGSKADMCSAKRHVRFTPKSEHWAEHPRRHWHLAARSIGPHPPSLALPVGLAVGSLATPADLFHRRRDAPLLGSADLRRFDPKTLARYLADRNPGVLFVGEVGSDVFLPDVGFVAGRLLRHDVIALKIFIGPPTHTVPEANDRFGK